MVDTTTTNQHAFLTGGGEMGERTRQHDWSKTTLGPPDQWPQSLRATLSIILNARFPMFLWWGPDLIQFYNDAYRPSLGNDGKHPTALGQKGVDCWPEIWPVIKPLIDGVLAGGDATWNEDQLIPIYRNGRLEDVYWTFSYGPVKDESGQVAGVLVTTYETTQQVVSRQKTEESEARFRSLIDESPVATGLFVGPELVIEVANEGMIRFFGKGPSVVGKPIREVLTNTDGNSAAIALLNQAFATGNPFSATAAPAELTIDGVAGTYYFDLSLKPLRDAAGVVYAILETATDVTEQVLARQKLEKSEAFANSVFFTSPVANAVFVGENMTVRIANENMLSLWASDSSAMGRPFMEVLPELVSTPLLSIYRQVLRTGETYYESEAKFDLILYGKPYTGYYNYSYKALVNAAGERYGALSTAIEVTEQVLARKTVEESEAKFRSLIDEAPVATALFLGRDMTIEVANETMIGYWGKTDAVLGRTFAEAVPELEGQPFFAILDEVFTTGNTYHESGGRADVVVDGVLGTYYFDYTFKPLRNAAGEVYAVLDTAIDVTEQVMSRQKLEEAEAALRGAVELAQLGTWSIDVATNGLTYSGRLIEWFGYDPAGQDYSRVIPILDVSDQERVATAIAWALDPQSGGVYNEVYTVIHPQTGRKRILHAQGKTVFDATGKAVRMNGTAQDITSQRELQLTLAQQVQERTEELAGVNQQLAATVDELASANEELAAINEELLVSNEETTAANNELSEANSLLNRSNSNLEKFAYIASHDLQEPLRKIQSFGDMLKSQYAGQLGDGVPYLERMQLAASRMSTLIRDLLTYSRMATQQETVGAVSLSAVVASVLTDLDLRIQETGATVNVVPLPTIQGDRSQLEQLFQNLFSNALKFGRADVKPVIEVTCRLVYPHELPPTVKPARMAKFYRCIDVADNGIGFDEKYLDRIFQVFQRLHGKNEFSGTGIGLAICEKVMTNHGGAITATSQRGQGATFSVYFPG